MLFNTCSLRNGSGYLHVNADALGMKRDAVTLVEASGDFGPMTASPDVTCPIGLNLECVLTVCYLQAPAKFTQCWSDHHRYSAGKDLWLKDSLLHVCLTSAPCRCGGGSRGSVKFCRVTKNKSDASVCSPVHLLTQDCCPGPLMAL